MPTHTQLKGVSEYGRPHNSDILESNLVSFFNWGLLGVGGFYNVTIPTSGAFGGNQHRLRPVRDPNYSNGQVWEAFRNDWIWETGVEYSYQPIRVSGVYVNGTFYSTSTTGAYAHTINYPLGQVKFNSAISTSSVVTCEYSHRHYHFYSADVPWWQEVHPRSFRVDDSHFLQEGSGAWNILSQNRVQLPVVVVEAAMDTDRKGLEVGGVAAIVTQDVIFHVLSETRWDMKQMHDILTTQWNKRLLGYDNGLMLISGALPLDVYGSPVASGMMYPDWTNLYYWEQIRIQKASGLGQRKVGPYYYCAVRLQCEYDRP